MVVVTQSVSRNGVEVHVRYSLEGFSETWESFVESCGPENERNGQQNMAK